VLEVDPDVVVGVVVVEVTPPETVVGVVDPLGVTTVVGVPVVLDVDVEEVVVEVLVAPDVVDVVVCATPVSGDVQFAGGLDVPVAPGISKVPAHPKLENCPSRVTLPPSENETVDDDSRMKPDASMEIRSRMPVYPWAVNTPRAALMALASSLVTLGAVASDDGSIASEYWVTATPSTVDVPTSVAPDIAGCERFR
jgi:hypothetical protein